MQTKLPINTILQDNSLELLKTLPDSSIDLIFADPPYWMRVDGVLKRPEGSDGVKRSKKENGALLQGKIYHSYPLKQIPYDKKANLC